MKFHLPPKNPAEKNFIFILVLLAVRVSPMRLALRARYMTRWNVSGNT